MEAGVINKRIAHIQRVVNGQNFDIRKTLNKYSYILEQQRWIIHQRRRKVLMEEGQPSLLSEREPELFNSLCKTAGEKALQTAEKQVTLYQIDRCWADYLDYVSYVREGIHLVSIGRKNPLDEFHKLVIKAFEGLSRRIMEEVIKTFKTVEVTREGINFQKEGLKRPSATWTYMVNDNYFLNISKP